MRRWIHATLFAAAFAVCLDAGPARAQSLQDGLILLYEFDEGSGNTVTDTSGFGTAHNLTIQDVGNTSWGNGFLTINSPTIITNPSPPVKIYDAVIPVNELSLEAWVTPVDATLAGPSRIFNISSSVPADSPTNRNFQLGIDAGQHIQARLRTDSSTTNGGPFQDTNDSGPVVVEPTELLHLVYTRDNTGVATIYVDGVERSDPATTQPGDLSGWDQSYLLALAHEHQDPSLDSRSFIGDYHLIGMWNRPLSAGEVAERFAAGPVPPGMGALPGDVNEDGTVDLDDYGVIRDNFLAAVDPGTNGDLNFDRVVDWNDFREWKVAFSGGAATAAAIPEPGTICLSLVVAGLAILMSRRAVHRSLAE